MDYRMATSGSRSPQIPTPTAPSEEPRWCGSDAGSARTSSRGPRDARSPSRSGWNPYAPRATLSGSDSQQGSADLLRRCRQSIDFGDKSGVVSYEIGVSAEGQNRTDDTSIFSAVLYQLSYLGAMLMVVSAADGCQDSLMEPVFRLYPALSRKRHQPRTTSWACVAGFSRWTYQSSTAIQCSTQVWSGYPRSASRASLVSLGVLT